MMSSKPKYLRRTRECQNDPGEGGSEQPELVSEDVSESVLQLFQDDDNDESQYIIIDSPAYVNQRHVLDIIDFEILAKQKYFIDKTDFVTQVLTSPSRVLAFFRHRNSMKTTHLKAIECYCDFKEDRSKPIFEELKVKIDEKYFGQFCVLYVPFHALDREIQLGKSSSVMTILRELIIFRVRTYLNDHSTTIDEIKSMVKELSECDNIALFPEICSTLQRKFQKRVILLFDNVDVPFLILNRIDVENVFKTLLNNLVSGPPCSLFKIVMMGNIVPSIFLKRSSFPAFTRVDIGGEVKSFGPKYFMFTKEDVKLLCTRYNYPVEAMSELESCYGGYSHSTFNSFSIIQFMENNSQFNLTTSSKVPIMWYNFHSRDCLHISDKIRVSKAELYIWGRVLEFQDKLIELYERSLLTYERFSTNHEIGFMYLLYGAYLTQVKFEDGKRYLKIPNEEVRCIFRERRNQFMAAKDSSISDYEMWNDVFNSSADYEDFCALLNARLINCSYRTFSCELAYHVFLLVIFACNRVFRYRDEPETGLGIADIVLIPVQHNRNPIVIEIAYLNEISAKKRETAINKMFNDKVDQVRDRKYGFTTLESYDLMDILILVGCCRQMYPKFYKNQKVPK